MLPFLSAFILGLALWAALEFYDFYGDRRRRRVPVHRALAIIAADYRDRLSVRSRCPRCGVDRVETVDRGLVWLHRRFTGNHRVRCPRCRITWTQRARRPL